MTIMPTQASEKVALAFPTPIFKTVLPDTRAVNKALLKIVLDREKKQPSTTRSNVGGWQSKHDFLNWPEPEIAQLKTVSPTGFAEFCERIEAPGLIR